ARLKEAVQAHQGGGINVHFVLTDEPLDTTAGNTERAVEDGLRKAREAIHNDPGVREIIDVFGGEVVDDSIRPVQRDD
ncbi:MAG: hypothetical protein KJO76_03560, partial [Gammaproteobacteria bacterium]|nr:hypothetical protein [Gammaproteobacteria bacterium]